MAKFGYEIEARDKTRGGVDEAKRNLTGLGDIGKKVGGILAAAFAGFTLAKVAGEIKKCVDLFGQQEKAEIRLAAAARNNPMLNGEAVKGLKAYASQLQSTSIFGDELIIQQEAFLATLGLSEDKIKRVMGVAVDLASTGMVSLESATRNIAKTFGGMTGELGELIPGLKTLTKEQLEAGEAVEYLSKAYGGMAQAAAQGVSGAMQQTKNLIGDMRESLGAALAPVVLSVTQAIQPIILKITSWLKDHQRQIINLFINLPEVLKVVFTGVWDMIKQIFTLDYWVKYLTALGLLWIDMIKAAMMGVWAVVKGAAEIIWEPLKTGFDWVVYGIKVGINAIIEALNTAMETAHNVLQVIQHPFKAEKRTAFAGGAGTLEAVKPAPVDVNAMAEALKRAGSGVWDALKEGGRGMIDFVLNVADIFAPIGEEIKTGVAEILGRELSASVASPVEALTAAIEQGRGPGAGPERVGGWSDVGASTAMTGAGTAPAAIGWLAQLGAVLQPIVQGFVGLITPLASVQMILNPLSTIIKGMMAVLQPVIDTILTPIIGILTILGNTIGKILLPIFQVLAPVIELVSKAFIWLYNNVIVPVGNMMITIFAAVGNFFISIINAIIWAVNLFLPKKHEIDYVKKMNADSMKLEKIDYGDVTSAGSEAVAGAETATGAGASYTAGRDINVTVNVYTGAIAGDGGFRQLAIMIRDEIFAVEALGV